MSSPVTSSGPPGPAWRLPLSESVPAPPTGPGVQPPFVAAPVEGRQARIWLGLGIAGGLLVACCGLGVVTVTALGLLSQQALNEQAQRAVSDYLEAKRQGEWEQAYELRCEADQRAQSLPRFVDQVSSGPRIQEYEVGDLRTTPGDDPFDPSSGQLDVPVTVTYTNGESDRYRVPLAQDTTTGQLEVCGRVPRE